jgi:uncharacterized cupredoxin-like copper-binding protein
MSLVLILAACSAGAWPSASDVMPMASNDQEAGFAWGEPAEASLADRVVEIHMLDELRFEPASVEVKVGETVTFKVVNDGKLEHDFTLGDAEAQDEHDAEMAAGRPGMGHDEPNTMTLAAGAGGELTWHFTAAATIFYGCHIPGHYAARMVGNLTIAGS